MADYSPRNQAVAQSTMGQTGASNPLEGIEHPGINDVMFGRGGDTNYHIGNHRFRVLADEHRHEYRSASRKEKALVVQEVVRCWRARGGRFLTKTDPEKGDESRWHDVGDCVAKKKAAKILSEKAPAEKNKEGGKSKGRKRPAVDSIDDRPTKEPAVAAAAGVSQPSGGGATVVTATAASLASPAASLPGTAPSLPVAAVASLTSATSSLPASLLQQAKPPTVQPSLQSAAPSLSTLQQMLQLPGAGTLNSSSVARHLLSGRGNPMGTSALAMAAGFSSSDLDVSRLALAAHVIAQEQAAARAKLALTNAAMGDLRVAALAKLLVPGLFGTSLNPDTPTLASSLRPVSINTDQLRVLLEAAMSREEQKRNDNSSHSRRDRGGPSDPPSG